MKHLALSLSLLLWLAFGLVDGLQGRQSSSAPRTKINVSKLGPQVGERVPEFTLRDQHGTPRTLPSTMGPKGVMLVFIRSADW